MSKKQNSKYLENKTYNTKMSKKHTNMNKIQNIVIEKPLKVVNTNKGDELKILKDELYRECVRLRELIYQESKRKGYVF